MNEQAPMLHSSSLKFPIILLTSGAPVLSLQKGKTCEHITALPDGMMSFLCAQAFEQTM